MASPDDNLNTTPQAKENNAEVETNASTADQQAFIVNSIKALQALVNQSRGRTSGMRPTELDFEEDDLSHPFTGSEYVEDKYKDVAPTHRTKEEDLSKPFKEAQLKSPFSSRILMFSAPKNKMPPTFEYLNKLRVEIKNEFGDGALDMTKLDSSGDSVGSGEVVRYKCAIEFFQKGGKIVECDGLGAGDAEVEVLRKKTRL
ncbi:hypothetical protein Tco_1106880 [Tanacetum coccineum]